MSPSHAHQPSAASAAGAAFGYENPLVRRAARGSPVRLRLFCFPHAGAGASAFGQWPALLPDDVEVAAVALPGREDRLHDPDATHSVPLIRSLVQALRPYLRLPVAFFGHSGGALLAFEVARAMRQRLRVAPVHLFVSGQPAPHLPRRDPLHTLDDAEFDRRIAALGGIHADLLDDEPARRMLMRAVRADFTLWETHEFRPGPPLDTPITVFGGEADPRATPDELAAWCTHTTGRFRTRMFPCGHFFVNTERAALLDEITRDLEAAG